MSGDITELQMIVQYLNNPPFNLGLTLVTFHGKTPLQLLQLVNDVYAFFDPTHKQDLRDEDRAQSAERMLQFLLGVLNYQVPDNDIAGFTSKFIDANIEAIHPALFYMLDNLNALKKRAYLARYLKNLDVPEEMFADPNVVALFQEYKALQQEFKEVHRTVDAKRQEKLDPQELHLEIEQLTQEREQLTTKLSKLKDKVDGPELSHMDFDQVLAATHALRKEQEEESKLYQSLQEEKQKQLRADTLYVQARGKLRNLEESDIARQDPARLLDKTREEVGQVRIKLEKLMKDERAKDRELHELQDAISSDPMMEEQVDELEHENNQLQALCERLTQKRDELHADSADGKMGFFRDNAAAVEKKKDKLIEQLEDADEEKRDAEAELRSLDEQLGQLNVGNEKPKSDAEMKAYMKELQKKTEKYKEKKTLLQACRDEVKVLQRTEELLRSRDDNITEFNEQMEKDKGVEGYANTQEALEDVSTKKNKIDKSKGDTLDEISRIVANITQVLKNRKNKLAPQIKELRSIRHKFEEVEKDYIKNKKIYDNCALGLESERISLEQGLEQNLTGIQEEESSYHFLSCLSTISQAREDQTAQELSFQVGEDRLSEKFKTYREHYDKGCSEEEALGKKLRKEKVTVGETHNDHVEQRSMFANLRTIMDLKLKLQEDTKKRMHEEENNIIFGNMEENRMVIDQ